jgi:hypothetical protein
MIESRKRRPPSIKSPAVERIPDAEEPSRVHVLDLGSLSRSAGPPRDI